MEPDKFIEWLKAEGLWPVVESHYRQFKIIYEKCLAVNDEQVLIIGDYGYPTRRISPILVGCYLLSGKELGKKCVLAMQEPKAVGESADDEVIESLFALPEKSVIIQALSGRIGSLKHIGKSFRRFCKERKHRFVSTMSLGDIDTYLLKRVIQPIMVNYDDMKERHQQLKKILDKAKEVRITTKSQLT